ncbi:MAG: right-handed parallel beta-helix repeat-containing protein [Thermoanaerobaculia bacterium]
MKTLTLVLSFLLAPFLFAQSSSTDVAVTLYPLNRPESGTSATVMAMVRNRTSAPIAGLIADFTLSDVHAKLTAAPHPAWPQDQWSCTRVTDRHVRCRVDIAQGPDQFIPLMLTIDPVIEGRFVLTGQGSWTNGDATQQSAPYSVSLLLERSIVVTSNADSGPATLRDAISRLNDECTRDAVPCAVRFDLPNDARTIFLDTALPPITAPDFSIDGRVEGSSDIEIDGSRLTEGDGFDVRGEGPATIRDLAIGGFPGNGMQLTRRATPGNTSVFVYACSIGLRPDLTPNPNRLRGVRIDAPATNIYLGNNIISANVRSGVFIDGATNVTLSQDVLGDNTVLRNLGNGASGVFVGPASRRVDIVNCVIAGNADFGVAIAHGAESVRLVSTNRILGNHVLDIDHGLDAFSGYARDDKRAPTPRITSVRYDATTNRTIIEGTLDVPDASKEWTVTIFAPEAVWTDLPLQSVLVRDGLWSYLYEGHATFGTEYSAYADSSDIAYSTSEFSERVTLH